MRFWSIKAANSGAVPGCKKAGAMARPKVSGGIAPPREPVASPIRNASRGLRAVRAFAVLIPCPVRTFPLAEADEARRWLRESLGAIHQIDLGDGILQVKLIGQLESAAHDQEGEELNAFIRAHDRFRLLVDLREFDGWHGLDAVGDHLRLVRDHRMLVDRAAIVGTSALHKLAEGIGSRFIKGTTKYFDASDFAGAEAWLRAG